MTDCTLIGGPKDGETARVLPGQWRIGYRTVSGRIAWYMRINADAFCYEDLLEAEPFSKYRA